MNCREKILSEDYMSILLDYVPEEADQEDEAFCYQQVDGTLGIYYLDAFRDTLDLRAYAGL